MAIMNVIGAIHQSHKADGIINAGGKVELYLPGTSTPYYSSSTSGMGGDNSHPVILDSSGYADIWINQDVDIVIKDSSGTVIRTKQNINPNQPTGSSITTSNNTWTGTNDFQDAVTVKDADATNSPLTVGQFQTGGLDYVATGGTPPNLTATLPLTPIDTTFNNGANFKLRITTAPSSGSVTLNVNGIGALPLFYNGAQIAGAGPLVTGDIWDVIYDATGPRWHLWDVTSSGANTFTGLNIHNPASGTLADIWVGAYSRIEQESGTDTYKEVQSLTNNSYYKVFYEGGNSSSNVRSRVGLQSGHYFIRMYDDSGTAIPTDSLDIDNTTGILKISRAGGSTLVTDAATTPYDCDTTRSNVFKVTVAAGGTFTFNNPTGLVPGLFYTWIIAPSGGSLAITWGSMFTWANGIQPTTLTSGVNNVIACVYEGTTLVCSHILAAAA